MRGVLVYQRPSPQGDIHGMMLIALVPINERGENLEVKDPASVNTTYEDEYRLIDL